MISLQSPASSDQHRSQVCGPTAVPCPYEYEQRHEASGRTDHAVWHDLSFTQSPAAKRADSTSSPCKAPRNNHTPDLSAFPNGVHPIQLLASTPGPGGEWTTQRDLPMPHHASFLTLGVSKLPIQQDAYPCTEYSYSNALFHHERQLHVNYMNSCAPPNHLNSHAWPHVNYHAPPYLSCHAQPSINSCHRVRLVQMTVGPRCQTRDEHGQSGTCNTQTRRRTMRHTLTGPAYAFAQKVTLREEDPCGCWKPCFVAIHWVSSVPT